MSRYKIETVNFGRGEATIKAEFSTRVAKLPTEQKRALLNMLISNIFGDDMLPGAQPAAAPKTTPDLLEGTES
jgi:hypothetical protein